MNNKQVVEKFYETYYGRDFDKFDEILTSDFQGHAGAGADVEQLKASIGAFFDAFPDMTVQVRHLIAEGDLVSSWVTIKGTHENNFAGVPGSGRQISVAGWDLFRIADGRIAELTQFCDLFTLMNQIGALPTTAPA